MAYEGRTQFANDWGWFIGVPGAAILGSWFLPTQEKPVTTGFVWLDLVVVGFVAFALTWIAGFLLRLARAPAILLASEKARTAAEQKRADELAASAKSREERQAILDALTIRITEATRDILNNPAFRTQATGVAGCQAVRVWIDTVHEQMVNSKMFAVAEMEHFATIGFMQPIVLTGIDDFDHMLSIMRVKFERLREIIKRHQDRIV